MRCQFGLTCSRLLNVFPCFPEGGCTEARLQRLNHILYPCPPAYLGHRGRLLPSAPPGETPRLSRPSWRDFISAAWPGPPWGLLQVGCDQNKAASFQCGGAAGLLWAPHKQTASSFLFVAWSNKMTNCSTHVYKLEAVKHCMHQTGAFSFLYLSASCRWTAFCWLWNYWFGVRKTLWSEPEKHHGHTDKSTFCSHSATSVQNPFWV